MQYLVVARLDLAELFGKCRPFNAHSGAGQIGQVGDPVIGEFAEVQRMAEHFGNMDHTKLALRIMMTQNAVGDISGQTPFS